MTLTRKVILCLGAAAFVAMGLFPPWTFTRARMWVLEERGYSMWPVAKNCGYHWLLEPPIKQTRDDGNRTWYRPQLDFGRLGLQWALVAVVTAVAVVVFRRRKARKP